VGDEVGNCPRHVTPSDLPGELQQGAREHSPRSGTTSETRSGCRSGLPSETACEALHLERPEASSRLRDHPTAVGSIVGEADGEAVGSIVGLSVGDCKGWD
jgi:hypothetical protein